MGLWKSDETVTAEISECGNYRNWLLVRWDETHALAAVVGLNPSKADTKRDDPTCRKCVNWARRNNYGGLLMLNAYPFRATKPRDMMAAADPFGKQSTTALVKLVSNGDVAVVIAAWGGGAKHLGRGEAVKNAICEAGYDLHCFGINKDGSPLHPCYVSLGEVKLWAAGNLEGYFL